MTLTGKLSYLFERRDRRHAAGLLALMTVGAGCEAVSIALIFPLIVMLSGSGPSLPAALEWISPWMVLFVYFAKIVYLAGLYTLQYRFIFRRQVALSRRLFSAYLRAPYTFHLQRNSSELLRNLNQEVHWIFTGVIVPAASLLIESLVVLAIMTVLLWIDPVSAGIVTVVVGAVGAVAYRAVRQKTGALGRSQQAHGAAMIRRVQEGIGGIKEVKVLGHERYFLDAYEGSAAGHTRALQFLRTIAEMPRLAIEALMIVGIGGILLIIGSRGGPTAQALPLLGVFAMAAIRLMPSLNRMAVAMTSVRYYAASIDAVYSDLRLLEEAPRQEELPSSAPPPPVSLSSTIEVNDVTYTYPGADQPALRGVSLRIRKGERVAFAGVSGAGKTTIVDVILGLLNPDEGRVLVDGRDIRENLPQWQRMIGYIPQHVFLSDEPIRRNVAFGLPDAQIDEARVRKALEAAQLTALIDSLPEGVDTPVGERGVRLSGGQRQRIGIARALYKDPDVLVMDEATSALDQETENAVAQAIEGMGRDKTIFIIAHRPTTMRNCDRLFVMAAGEVMAETTYAELADPGVYAER